LCSTGEAFIHAAISRLMIRHLARGRRPSDDRLT
jgi:hypothetical protein